MAQGKIRTGVYITKLGYQGKITVYENGRYIWSKSTGINRLTREDARQDAIDYRRSVLEEGFPA